MSNQKTSLIPVILLFFCLLGSTAQGQNTSVSAGENIKKLKNGALIVRIPTKANKLMALNDLLKAPDIKETTRKEVQNRIHSTILKRDTDNAAMVYALRNLYDFSTFLIMNDSSNVALNDGVREGIFLNDKLESDPSIKLNTEDFFILKLESAGETKTDALVIANGSGTALSKPFPYYVKARTFGEVFAGIFSARAREQINYLRIIEKLNKNLHKFYGRSL